MEIGKYTYGHPGIKHVPLRGGAYKIGNFCSIAGNCKIYTGRGGHRNEFVSAYPFGAIHNDIFQMIFQDY